MSSNISEFERTKPTKTMLKINNIIKYVENQQAVVDSREANEFVNHLLYLLNDMKDSLKKGE
jgi:hypothetical protein